MLGFVRLSRRSDGLGEDQISTASPGASETALGPLTSKFWLRYRANLTDGIRRAETQLKQLITHKFHVTPPEVEQARTDYLKLVNSLSDR